MELMKQWRPIPRALILDTLIHRWTKDSPAPDLVGFSVALDMHLSGSPWSSRKLSQWAGWTRYHSNRVLSDVKEYVKQWENKDRPLITNDHRPHDPNNINDLKDKIEPKSATIDDGFSHHARGSTITPTPTTTDPETVKVPISDVKSERIDLGAVWSELEDIRLLARPNSNRAKLGGRRDMLRVRVKEHGREAVVLAWRWWWESSDSRAEFLRGGGYSYSTFLRAKNLREYVDLSNDWTPGENIGGSDWFDDAQFDDLGNLITLKK